jgi:hypothetical protein
MTSTWVDSNGAGMLVAGELPAGNLVLIDRAAIRMRILKGT